MDSSSIAQSVIQGGPQCIGDEPQGIQEVALSGAIGAYEKRQWTEADVARGDAAVVAEDDPGNEGRVTPAG
jgi:hypothetical protein